MDRADLKTRKQVSADQMTGLLDFLKEHQELAKGLTRGRRGKLQTLKLWNLCAKRINAIDGATKDGKGWSKYWCDWKYRVKKRALEIRVAKESNKPPPDGVMSLTPMEDVILRIIGDGAVKNIVIKSDPLGAGDYAEELDDLNDDVPEYQYLENTPIIRSRKRKRPSVETLDLDVPGPSFIENKHKTRQQTDELNSDHEDTLEHKFLQLERERLDSTKIIQESVQTIAAEMSRLVDVMGHLRDYVVNNRFVV